MSYYHIASMSSFHVNKSQKITLKHQSIITSRIILSSSFCRLFRFQKAKGMAYGEAILFQYRTAGLCLQSVSGSAPAKGVKRVFTFRNPGKGLQFTDQSIHSKQKFIIQKLISLTEATLRFNKSKRVLDRENYSYLNYSTLNHSPTSH